MSTLYLVATPIGNLEDITARAVRVLRETPVIAAEDTRVTGPLLAHLGIATKPISYFEHNKLQKLEQVLARLIEGDVALVSDAGTPGLNDPGYELVRAAVRAGHTICPIPGPASPISALVASGLPTDAFLYLGYLPRKAGERKAALGKVAALPYTLIFLEAPHRLATSLHDMKETLGDRRITVARELTKLHEEIFRGTVSEACQHFTAPRGEFVLVVHGAEHQQSRWTDLQLRRKITAALKKGVAPSTLAASLAAESGWPRRDVYEEISTLRRRA